MQVLKYNQYYLTLIGISSNRLAQLTNEFGHFASNYVLIFALVCLMFTGSTIYAYQHMYQLTLALRAILLLCGSLQCAGSYISLGLNMSKVKLLQLKLQEFVDKGYLLMAAGLFIAATLYSSYFMWIGNFDTSTWLLPYNFYIPFDSSTVYGWYLFWLIQCYIALAYSLTTSCSMTYFVSCCSYICAICDHFELLVRSFSSKVEENLKNNKKMNASLSDILRLNLNRIVDLHLKAYEFSELLGDVFSGVIFWMLSCNIVFFASALYQVEHTIGSLDIMILYDILCLIVSLLWPYGLCYGATLASVAGFSTGANLYNSNWYNFPIELQMYIPFITARSQREIIFDGFHFFGCNLQCFIRMNNSAGSFYLMFRNVATR